MPALGHKGSFAIVSEVTWGTDPGSGYEYTPIASEALKVEQQFIFVKAVRSSRNGAARKVLGQLGAGGSYTFEANPEEHLGILLKNTLPSEATVDNGSGNGGLHTFTPSATLPAGITALVDRDVAAAATNVWAYVGGRVRKLALEASEGSTLKCTADLSFQKGTSGNFAGTPSYSTENPFVYHQGVFTVDGTGVAIKSFKLSIDTGLLDKRGKLGSRYIQAQQANVYNITGEIEAYFDDMTLVNKFMNGSDSALVLTFTGSNIAGAYYRTLTITIPYAQFLGESPAIAGPDSEIMLKLPFQVYQPVSATALATIALQNSKRTAY